MADTLFTEVRYQLDSLVSYVELGEVALPDLQRPFVWPNAKVRDLFDSMYRGYPVGYLLFWQNALAAEARKIGSTEKQKAARLLIVDGQQRLTSLYAVLRGVPVVREDYSSERIQIAFNPLTEEFSVADAATAKDKTLIPDISVLWTHKTGLFAIVNQYLGAVESVRPLDPAEKEMVQNAVQRLYALRSYPFTALELASSVEEDQVSEVFVRINSQGKSLNQSDFILTLMSVYWDEGRAQLEHFCRDAKAPKPKSPFNHFIQPSPDQLLRAAVGLGFERARLKHVYSLLRGKDLDTGRIENVRRLEQFEIFKKAQEQTVNLGHWHGFFNAVRQAGYRSDSMVSSDTALIYAYVFYLLGKTRYGVEEPHLRKVIAQWFFMSNLTGRYSGSPESTMEYDLAMFRGIRDATGFVRTLQAACDEELTGDFWSISLPGKKEAPRKYLPVLSKPVTPAELLEMYRLHALPDGWESMEYGAFLERRRELMATLIRDGYRKLVGTTEQGKPAVIDVTGLVKSGEGITTEFKSTLRTNLHTRKPDPKMEFTVLRTVVGFLNAAAGGTLVLGVADDGAPIGVDEDGFESDDKMMLHFDNLMKDRVGSQFSLYVHPHFTSYGDRKVLVVSVKPSRSPAFLKDGPAERFFVRAGASTAELAGNQMQQYIQQRFQ